MRKQKQPSRGILQKRCSEKIHQIYRRTPMPKCHFSKDAKQLYWNHIQVWVFSCKLAAYFQNTFSRNTSAGLLLENVKHILCFLHITWTCKANLHSVQKQPPEVFYKMLKNISIVTGKHLWSLSSKRDSNTGVFLWILRNFWRKPTDGCFFL